MQDDPSVSAPGLIKPSISENKEKEEDDEDKNNEMTMTSKEMTIREEDDESGGEDGRGNTQMSPLLTSQIQSRDTIGVGGSSDCLAGRGELPNGSISAVIR